MSAFAKALMVALIVLNLLLAWGPLLTAPDSILALHFRMGGVADNFGSTIVWGLSMTFACGIMLLAFMSLPISFDRINPKYMSLPRREHWLKPENMVELKKLLTSFAAFGGLAGLLFLAGVQFLVLEANSRKPPRMDETSFVVLLVCFIGYTLASCVWLIRRLCRAGTKL